MNEKKDNLDSDKKGEKEAYNSNKIKLDFEYTSEEEKLLEVPLIPEIPKQKNKLDVNSLKISKELLKKRKNLEEKGKKLVLVNCDRCKEVIIVPIPDYLILNSQLPIVPVSYVHKNPSGEDLHCITLFLDHDFDVRRQRISEVVLDKACDNE